MVRKDIKKGLRPTGNGFLVLYLAPSKDVSSLISEPLKVVDVIPNYTLGGFFGALYHTNSTNNPALTGGRRSDTVFDFNIITALTRWKDKKGFYLCPVDPETKLKLRCEKEGNGISIREREGFSPYISLRVMPLIPKLPFSFHLSFIEVTGKGIIFPKTLPIKEMAISYSSIRIPASSPLTKFRFKSKLFSIIFSLGQVVVEEPKAIKRKILKELKTGVYGINIEDSFYLDQPEMTITDDKEVTYAKDACCCRQVLL